MHLVISKVDSKKTRRSRYGTSSFVIRIDSALLRFFSRNIFWFVEHKLAVKGLYYVEN